MGEKRTSFTIYINFFGMADMNQAKVYMSFCKLKNLSVLEWGNVTVTGTCGFGHIYWRNP